MQPIRRAVIDVGTNSVKLLVADVAGQAIEPVIERSIQTRLGKGLYQTHRLRDEAVTATAKAVAEFACTACEAQAGSIRVIATSAAREAVNREELTAAIEQASRLKVEVISGDQEADWGFQGVTSDPRFANGPLLLLDVGGGSMQLAFGQAGQKPLHHSYPLGTVRLLEALPCSDPPKPEELAGCRAWLKDFLRREVLGKTSDIQPSRKDAQLVGVGGTGTILACMEAGLKTFDRARIEATRLSVTRVAWHLERLWSLPLEERKNIPGLPKNRADVILMGVAIYHAVMEEFGFAELAISTRGLRFAALT